MIENKSTLTWAERAKANVSKSPAPGTAESTTAKSVGVAKEADFPTAPSSVSSGSTQVPLSIDLSMSRHESLSSSASSLNGQVASESVDTTTTGHEDTHTSSTTAPSSVSEEQEHASDLSKSVTSAQPAPIPVRNVWNVRKEMMAQAAAEKATVENPLTIVPQESPALEASTSTFTSIDLTKSNTKRGTGSGIGRPNLKDQKQPVYHRVHVRDPSKPRSAIAHNVEASSMSAISTDSSPPNQTATLPVADASSWPLPVEDLSQINNENGITKERTTSANSDSQASDPGGKKKGKMFGQIVTILH